MAKLLLLMFLVALLVAQGHSGGESTGELYWKTKLGDIPMPKVIKDSLLPAGSGVGDAKANPIYAAQELQATTTMNNKNNIINSAKIIYDVSVKLIDDSKSGIFFFEKDLTHFGNKLKLRFMTNDDGTKFLPPKLAQKIPFSSEKLPQILSLFSVKPKSEYAKTMEETIKMCEAKAISGEDKLCTSSLEGMVDYVMSKVGNHVKAYSSEIDKDVLTEYRVEGAQKISNGDNMVCHKMSYPYAVFSCHSQKNKATYVVSLVDSDGKKNKAVVVCHKDTSSWSPGHLAFQLLKVKPGSVPICHVINDITVAFVPY